MNNKLIPASVLPWLLEEDPNLPTIRYLTRTEYLGMESSSVAADRRKIMQTGPVPVILDALQGDYWVESGPGYYPKYTGSVWSFIMLAMLRADGQDARIQAAGNYLLDHARAPNGGFSMTGKNAGLIQCLQGNLFVAMINLGFKHDDRLQIALDWLARSVTGAGIALHTEKKAPLRYLRSANSGPGFLCSANDQKPCAWGAVKTMLALAKIPPEERTPVIQTAIETGVDFLFSRDPAAADYPMGYSSKPNRSWFRFGFPLGYVSDVLQVLEVLGALGYGHDPRLKNALDLLLSKMDEHGRWSMEYTYNGKTWVDIETKKKPSKWVTLRALRVLKYSGLYQP